MGGLRRVEKEKVFPLKLLQSNESNLIQSFQDSLLSSVIVLAICLPLTLSCRRGGSATYEFVSQTASFLFSARQQTQSHGFRTQSLEIDWRSRYLSSLVRLHCSKKVRAVPQLHVPIRFTFVRIEDLFVCKIQISLTRLLGENFAVSSFITFETAFT